MNIRPEDTPSNLLSNTKLTENIIQLVVVGDFAGDLAEIVEVAANVEG